jgi:hypothetical protein
MRIDAERQDVESERMKLLLVDRGHFVVVLDVGLLIKAIVMAFAFYGATPAATDH